MKRRHFILMLGGSSASAMTIGSGAFSSAQMERGMDVNVVDDESALVWYDESDIEDVANEADVSLVTVFNQFPESQEMSIVGVRIEEGYEKLNNVKVKRGEDTREGVEIIEGESEFNDLNAPEDGIAPGSHEEIVGMVTGLAPDESVQVEITIVIKGEGVTAQLFGDTREFQITRANDGFTVDDISYVQFPGNSGNVQIKTDSDGDESSGDDPKVNATAYYTHDGHVKVSGSEEVEINTKLELGDDFGVSDGDAIAGVAIDGIDGVFVHPKFNDDPEVCDIEVGGGGGSGGKAEETVDINDAFDNCLVDDDD